MKKEGKRGNETKLLAIFRHMCYDAARYPGSICMRLECLFFGAGCDSLPAVIVRDPLRRLIWCNSGTDSIVWMIEEAGFYVSGIAADPG